MCELDLFSRFSHMCEQSSCQYGLYMLITVAIAADNNGGL